MLNDINELAITYLPIETFTIHYSRMLSEIDPVNYIVTLIDNYTGKKRKTRTNNPKKSQMDRYYTCYIK